LRERCGSIVFRLLSPVIVLVPPKRPLRVSIESKRGSVRVGQAARNLPYFPSPANRTVSLKLPDTFT
jgi:hypothetical protein